MVRNANRFFQICRDKRRFEIKPAYHMCPHVLPEMNKLCPMFCISQCKQAFPAPPISHSVVKDRKSLPVRIGTMLAAAQIALLPFAGLESTDIPSPCAFGNALPYCTIGMHCCSLGGWLVWTYPASPHQPAKPCSRADRLGMEVIMFLQFEHPHRDSGNT